MAAEPVAAAAAVAAAFWRKRRRCMGVLRGKVSSVGCGAAWVRSALTRCGREGSGRVRGAFARWWCLYFNCEGSVCADHCNSVLVDTFGCTPYRAQGDRITGCVEFQGIAGTEM